MVPVLVLDISAYRDKVYPRLVSPSAVQVRCSVFGSSILDIAIGIVFVFLLLSLIASTINELLLSFANMRARFLAKGLKGLLNCSDGRGLMEELFNHGLIFGLYQGDYKAGKSSNLPSYIPARSFALAIMDLIPRYVATLPVGTQGAPGSQTAAATSGAQGATSTQAVTNLTSNPLEAFRNAVSLLPDAKVKEPLITMIDAANKDANELMKNIENWYNSTMDRVSGWYKFHTQWIIFLIGIVLTVSINVDTLVIARHLSNDSALRQSLVAVAQQTASKPIEQQQQSPIQDQTQRIQSLGLPIGWLEFDPPKPGLPKTQIEIQQENDAVAERRVFANPTLFSVVWYHLWGWLLTALAVSLGAPFWFDVLNKIMVVRSTVKPREKSHEEKSKD